MVSTALPEQIKISDQVLFQEIEGECVLLDLSTEQYFGLDEVGTSFWHLVSKDGTTETAIKNLRMEYDVDETKLRSDLARLIEELNAQNLIAIED